ncbi:MAG: hypothetical protein ACYTFO_09770 [Planctomycetota bacterium]|jgi:hypothetical protein
MTDETNHEAADALDQLSTPSTDAANANAEAVDLSNEATTAPSGATFGDPPPKGSLLMGAIGAAIGAVIGAAIWVTVGQVTGYNIGYVAILVGCLAGWGAVWGCKVRSDALGYVAAIAGLVAIVGGAYLNYHLTMRSSAFRATMKEDFEKEMISNPDYRALSESERDKVFDKTFQYVMDSGDLTFFNAMKSSGKDMAFLLLFGGLGVYYGYRVASGTGKRAAPKRRGALT